MTNLKTWDSPTVHVALTESGHPEDCFCGDHYSGIVMAWSKPSHDWPEGTWYNTGIVEWGKNPEEAFSKAMKKYYQISSNISETQIREAVKQSIPNANEIEKRMDKMMNQPSDLVLDSDNVSEDSDG